jgi:hypothetical protein
MKNIISRFWNEQTGAIVSAEIMLVATILVIGVLVGLASLRDSVVTELADVAAALGGVNQSFCLSGVCGHGAHATGSSFHDRADFCDNDNNHCPQRSKCVSVCLQAQSEQ